MTSVIHFKASHGMATLTGWRIPKLKHQYTLRADSVCAKAESSRAQSLVDLNLAAPCWPLLANPCAPEVISQQTSRSDSYAHMAPSQRRCFGLKKAGLIQD